MKGRWKEGYRSETLGGKLLMQRGSQGIKC